MTVTVNREMLLEFLQTRGIEVLPSTKLVVSLRSHSWDNATDILIEDDEDFDIGVIG